jgi:HEAT repeat protein
MRATHLLWVSSMLGMAGTVGACGCAKHQQQAATQNVAKNVSKWTEALKDPDSAVRIDALNHLGNVGYGSPALAFAPVAGALKDAEPAVRKEAIRNLWKFDKNAGEAIAALTDVKDNDADPKIRTDAATMIKAIQDRHAAPRK